MEENNKAAANFNFTTQRMKALKLQLSEMTKDVQTLREEYRMIVDRVEVLSINSRQIPVGRRTRNSA